MIGKRLQMDQWFGAGGADCMSHTYCHRCGRMMASGLPLCPHCGTSQDEQARAESKRRGRTTWLAVGVGAALGMAGGWLMFRNMEALV